MRPLKRAVGYLDEGREALMDTYEVSRFNFPDGGPSGSVLSRSPVFVSSTHVATVGLGFKLNPELS